MQRLELHKSGLAWCEAPEPRIEGPDQAIVRPLAVARCDLDLPIIQRKTLFRPPFAIGHEFVGEVVETSEDLAHEWPSGTRVAVSFQISCGHCASCKRGLSKTCDQQDPISDFGMPPGAHQFGGALSDLVLVPHAKQMMLSLPPDLDLAGVASLSDNIAESWKLAGRFLDRENLETVLIVGGVAASIGLYTALLVHQTSKAKVTYLDTDRSRVDMANRLGIAAEHVSKFPKSAGRFDLVCDCSAQEEGWQMALRSIAPGGDFTSASIFWNNKQSIPFLELYNLGAQIHLGRVDSIESMRNLLPFILDGRFTPEKIVTSRVPYKDALEAWQEPALKLVIEQ